MPRAIPRKVSHNAKHATSPTYTLAAFLLSGPMTDKYSGPRKLDHQLSYSGGPTKG
jgi:hypothetical protein